MVLTCDVCGAPIEGEPVIVEIDGAVLTLCQKCARKYTSVKGVKVIRGGPSQVQTTQQSMVVAKRESRRGGLRIGSVSLGLMPIGMRSLKTMPSSLGRLGRALA